MSYIVLLNIGRSSKESKVHKSRKSQRVGKSDSEQAGAGQATPGGKTWGADR